MGVNEAGQHSKPLAVDYLGFSAGKSSDFFVITDSEDTVFQNCDCSGARR